MQYKFRLSKKKIKLKEIRDFLKKEGLKIVRLNRQTKDLKNFFATCLSSLLIISIFSLLPIFNKFKNNFVENSKVVVNNSKTNFERTLEGKEQITNEINNSTLDSELNVKNLFDDIFESDEIPTDTVRLDASTLEQLFKDTDYDLKKIRQDKVVKPISISLLPNEMRQIESTKKRKDLFIKIILPLILEENNNVRIDRKILFSILNKNNNTEKEKRWLNKKFKQYGVVNKDLSTLKIRMDEVPVSLAIAQAAKETGWGTSRFAREGNALYGQWTWTGEGIKPAGADSSATHKVMKFKVLKASVKAYIRNLNTHKTYRKFRKERAIQRDNSKKLESLKLVDFLDQYAETGKEYTKVLKKIIVQNSLTDFDDAKILPTSKKMKNLI